MSNRTGGISARGSQRPAKNISGKNATRPMTLAEGDVLDPAAISRPMAASPAMATSTETASPAGLLGAGTPKATVLTTKMTTHVGNEIQPQRATILRTKMTKTVPTAIQPGTTASAASTHDGGAGVVDRRRSTPSSR